MNDKLKVIAGFALGTIAGAAIGILTAPEKGSKTRKKLKGRIDEFADQALHEAEDKFESAKKKYNESLDEVSSKGKEQLDKVKSALRSN